MVKVQRWSRNQTDRETDINILSISASLALLFHVLLRTGLVRRDTY